VSCPEGSPSWRGAQVTTVVSFREGSKIGIGDHPGQLATLIMAVIGRGDGIFRPRGSRFGDGQRLGGLRAGSDAAVAVGQLRLAGFQAGIDWSLATPL
jgi:hypothetical protein